MRTGAISEAERVCISDGVVGGDLVPIEWSCIVSIKRPSSLWAAFLDVL